MSASLLFGSVCSRIEAASVAWATLGWRAAFMSEIEAFPRAVLKHHFSETPLHGDFTTINAGDYEPIDLLVGGTPCQSFSIAGLRGGLADSRGNLALEYLRLAGRLRPRWLVWENVPGVFSSLSHDAPDPCSPQIDLDGDDGPRDGEEVVVEDSYDADESHAFSCFLAGLSELGYGFAYRVLDAQFFGVAQRRRRVFVVGHIGDWRRAAAVLFERDCLSGNPAPRRETGERPAPTISARPSGGGGLGTDFDLDGGLISKCLSASHTASGRLDPSAETFVTHALRGEGFDTSEDGTGRGTPLIPVAYRTTGNDGAYETGDAVGSLTTSSDPNAQIIAFAMRGREGGAMPEVHDKVSALRSASGGSTRDFIAFNVTPSNSNKDYNARESERAQALTGSGNRPSARGGDLIVKSAVRRLTPRECERLQGFPDGWTLVPYRGGMAADGPRYKALGNSMAVPCMAWIGRRIQAVEDLTPRPRGG